MAIIYTYPSGAVKADDLILVSEQDSAGIPTKNITVADLAAYLSGLPGGPWLPLSAGSSYPLTGDLYMAPSGSGFSVGSRNIVFRGIDDVGNELDSARIFTLDSTINPSGQDLYIQNANDVGALTTNIFVDAFGFVGIGKTNPGANLDIANDLMVGTNVQFGGATDFRFFQSSGSIGLGTSSPNFKMDIAGGDLRMEENYGIRFGGTGSNGQNYNIRTTGDPFGGSYPGAFVISRGGEATQIDFTLKYPLAAPQGQVQFNQYGSGNFTGTAAYNLEVDASGNIIETATGGGGGATFTAANSEATPHIVLGASAQAGAPAGGADGVYICAGSFGSATSNDEQINIGRGNATNGTQNIAIGKGNNATTSSAYGMQVGIDNTASGSRTWIFGGNNNMGTSDTCTIGRNNVSSFTGGVSSAGLMNISIGEQNELDCDKAAVLGFANDITGSFGWTIGAGNETVVVGNRLNGTLLGPARSATTGPRVIVSTGEFIGAGPENKQNSVEYYTPTASTSGVYHPALYNSASYADDVAAAAGGVGLGELYRNGSVVQIRMT